MKLIISGSRSVLDRKGMFAVTSQRVGRSRKLRYIATLAGWAQASASKEEAVAKLVARLEKQQKYEFARRYVPAGNGVMFVLFYADCWVYDIVQPDGSNSSCMMGREDSYDAALQKMIRSAMQYKAPAA